MGAGNSGLFCNTYGAKNYRLRIGVKVLSTVKDLRMATDPEYYSKVIAKKFNIHLKASGNEVKIKYNSNLPMGVAGRTKKSDPYTIEIGPSAMINESELANTLAHELNHVRSYAKGYDAPESTAYLSGDTLSKYIRGEK